jgi:hypothetical protein
VRQIEKAQGVDHPLGLHPSSRDCSLRSRKPNQELPRRLGKGLQGRRSSRSSGTRKLTGHKTEAVYRRYAIVDSTMLREAVDKLGALHAAEANYASSIRVSPVSSRNLTAPASIVPYFAVLLCARESGGMADALDLGLIPAPGT